MHANKENKLWVGLLKPEVIFMDFLCEKNHLKLDIF